MYYSDKPILSKKEDFLKRKYFAELVAKSLENLNSQDTFTIGLYGQWGTGKTSLVNMILEEIKENEKVVIVRFEPWNFSSTNQLLEQFFVHLANQFHWTKDKTLKEVGNALERYSDAFDFAKVIPHVGGAISFLGKRISKGIGKRIQNNLDKNDIMCQKEKVVQLLKGQNKRILVVIDDIDRLNNEQIRQVFQLITSVAKFPNMIYLLVFDKEIVVKALEKIQEGSGEEYLEKIIQMPIQIPDICSTEFRGIIFERLYNIVKEQEGIKINLEHWERLADTCVIPLLKNMRDVNRLCNLVQFKFSGIGTEVDFTDMVVISVIEMYYPTVYEWIKYNKNFLTGKLSGKRVYMANNKGQKELYDMYLNELKGKLKKSEERLQKECEGLSEIRKKEAKLLQAKIAEGLQDLNFLDVCFEIRFSKTSGYTVEGTDEVEFMISMNPGEPTRPLATVASGGELSRIMLAIKAVMADKDEIETLIFDEIDVGISGRTAQKVSEKMCLIGRKHQVICITHLAQIAAMADAHFLIEKMAENGSTVSQIRMLEREESISELARMLGGVKITDRVLESAKEMKELAESK